MQAAKAMARKHPCAGLSDHSLLAYVKSIIFLCVGTNILSQKYFSINLTISFKALAIIIYYHIETSLNTFANRADPDQAVLVRAA